MIVGLLMGLGIGILLGLGIGLVQVYNVVRSDE